MDTIRTWVVLGIALVCLAEFTACDNEGAAEKAGESIDKAVKDLRKKVN